jgi:hypothetical protein
MIPEETIFGPLTHQVRPFKLPENEKWIVNGCCTRSFYTGWRASESGHRALIAIVRPRGQGR